MIPRKAPLDEIKRCGLYCSKSRACREGTERREAIVLTHVVDHDAGTHEQRSPARTTIAARHTTGAVKEIRLKALLGHDLQISRLPVDELDVAKTLVGYAKSPIQCRNKQGTSKVGFVNRTLGLKSKTAEAVALGSPFQKLSLTHVKPRRSVSHIKGILEGSL